MMIIRTALPKKTQLRCPALNMILMSDIKVDPHLTDTLGQNLDRLRLVIMVREHVLVHDRGITLVEIESVRIVPYRIN
jgi:hypothetical protein